MSGDDTASRGYLKSDKMREVGEAGQVLMDVFNAAQSCGADPRRIALAKTNLEQSLHWAEHALDEISED